MACDSGLSLDEDILSRLLYLASCLWTSKPHIDLPLQWYLRPDPLSHCIYVWCRQHCCVNMSWWRMCCQRTLVRGKSQAVMSCMCFDAILLKQSIGYLKYYEEHYFAESFCHAVPTSTALQLCVFWCWWVFVKYCTKIPTCAPLWLTALK